MLHLKYTSILNPVRTEKGLHYKVGILIRIMMKFHFNKNKLLEI